MRYQAVLFFLTGLLSVTNLAADQSGLADDNAKINYSVGYQIGSDFHLQEMKLRQDALIKGIQDALAGEEPMMSAAEMRSAMKELGKHVGKQRKERQQTAVQKLLEENRQFLATNTKTPGVTTIESGLQYRVIKPGIGKSPTATDSVTVHYRGQLIDGNEFDSSYTSGEPAKFKLSEVIPGWTEGLQLMKEGAIWQLFVPAELAYGEKGKLANRTLIFEVELIAVN